MRGVSCVAAGVLIAAAAATSSGTTSAPDLRLSTTSYDLGALVPGQTNARSVRIRNSGAQPLEVRTRSTNAALRAVASPLRLPPGEEGEIRLEIRPPAWEEKPFGGEIYVYSNDPDSPLTKLRVTGTIDSPFDWSPKLPGVVSIPFGRGGPLVEIRIGRKDRGPIGPLGVTLPSPFVSAATVVGASGDATVTVALDAAAPPGPILGWVKIETGDPRQPLVEVPLRARVVGELSAKPYKLDFGIVDEGRPATAAVKIVNGGSRKVKILRAVAHLPVPAEATVTPDGAEHELRVLLRSPQRLRSLEGDVELFTDDPAEPRIHVPVEGWVAARNPFDPPDLERLRGLVRAAMYRDDQIPSAQFVDRILGGNRDERTEDLLLEAAADENWFVRQRAVEVLGSLRSRRGLEVVRRAVTDDVDEEVRRAAAAALFAIAGKDALPELMLALEDDDDWVRSDAVALLGELGDKRAIPALRRALGDEDEEVRTLAAQAIETLSGQKH